MRSTSINSQQQRRDFANSYKPTLCRYSDTSIADGGIVMDDKEKKRPTARVITGKLIEVDKLHSRIVVEYRQGDEWKSETLSTENWSNEKYQQLRGQLDREIKVTVEGQEVREWEPVGATKSAD
jgi:hypothetical protein